MYRYGRNERTLRAHTNGPRKNGSETGRPPKTGRTRFFVWPTIRSDPFLEGSGPFRRVDGFSLMDWFDFALRTTQHNNQQQEELAPTLQVQCIWHTLDGYASQYNPIKHSHNTVLQRLMVMEQSIQRPGRWNALEKATNREKGDQ